MEIVIDQISCSLLDCTSGTCHIGTLRDDFSELEKKTVESFIKKAFGAHPKDAFLTEKSPVWLRRQQEIEDLEKYIEEVTEAWYNMKMKAGLHEISSFFVISYQRDGMEEVLFLDNVLSDAMIVQAVPAESGLDYQLMKINSVMTSSFSKKDRFLIWQWRNEDLRIKEDPAQIEGETLHLWSEKLFHLKADKTEKEIYQVIERAVKDISFNHGIPSEQTLPELKAVLSETEIITPDQVAKAVFEHRPDAQVVLKARMADQGISESVSFDTNRLSKKDRTLKMITDAGIEIIVPSSLLKRTDLIEITTHEDGTSSIELHNIGQIKNK
ncbi:MAG: hypothetical protein IJC38_04510 [Erysipelotrichaceae bacterium]|nr:hypothetical protein [Erysipelotrichaceae bacterium]